ADIGIEQVDGDVIAAIRRRGDAPEDENAEQQPAEIVAVGNLHAEEIAQHHRDEDVERDDADEKGGDQLDAVDEHVHRVAGRRFWRLGDSGNGTFGFRHEARSKLLPLPCRGRAPRSGGWGSARSGRRTSPPAALRAAASPWQGRLKFQKPALYCVSEACSSFQIASGSPPAFFTSAAHFCLSGSADFFQASSCASEIL